MVYVYTWNGSSGSQLDLNWTCWSAWGQHWVTSNERSAGSSVKKIESELIKTSDYSRTRFSFFEHWFPCLSLVHPVRFCHVGCLAKVWPIIIAVGYVEKKQPQKTFARNFPSKILANFGKEVFLFFFQIRLVCTIAVLSIWWSSVVRAPSTNPTFAPVQSTGFKRGHCQQRAVSQEGRWSGYAAWLLSKYFMISICIILDDIKWYLLILYMHAYPHTYIPTYLPTYVPAYVPTYLHTYVHTNVPTYLNTYISTYLHTYIPTYLDTYLPTYIHACMHTYVHTYVHA